ncbi:hypothetical protein QBC34DRAFT_437361 [Podospora aff. communis PSN243]|uniref:Uncharacterized protein n=1 Tax=Podospora aff. communis PSN243 TaxID=3040156 RepID=A0AAV9GRJ3_9PEZI|nr:hypothetical protein QBC34DRAFT_437361 [Podospora aff. communis PSN243]
MKYFLILAAAAAQLLITHIAAIAANTTADQSAFYIWNTYAPDPSNPSAYRALAFFHDYEVNDNNNTITCEQLIHTDELFPLCDPHNNIKDNMKLLVLLFATLHLLISPASAVFWIYTQHTLSADQWGFYRSEPSCSTVSHHDYTYLTKPDVSWNFGVSCDGEGCPFSKRDPHKIDRLEMHTKFEHYTYYKNREGKLVDTQDKVVGTCMPARGKEEHYFDCAMPEHPEEHVLGAKAFLCKTDVW